MTEHRYRVRTQCLALVTESWTVTSPVPLSDAEVREIMTEGGDEDRGITLETYAQDEVADEADRTILEVRQL